MRDAWADQLFEASFAGIVIEVLSTSDTIKRQIARHSPPRRDGGRTDDMGADNRDTSTVVIFRDLDEETDHVQRMLDFVKATQSAEPQEYVHPIFGSLLVRVENVKIDAEAETRNWIEVACDFVEHNEDQLVIERSTSGIVGQGAGAVRAGVASTKEAIASVAPGLDTSLLDEIGDTVARWVTQGPVAHIAAELVAINARVADYIRTAGLLTNPERMPIYRRLIGIVGNVRTTGEQAEALGERVVTYVVPSGISLRVLCADRYGGGAPGREAAERVMRLNSIPDPSYIPAGQRLRMPSANPVGHGGA